MRVPPLVAPLLTLALFVLRSRDDGIERWFVLGERVLVRAGARWWML